MKKLEKSNTPIQKVASEFIKKWGKDKNTEGFSKKLGLFVSQLEDEDKELGSILIELVKYYNYYSRESINKILEEFYCKFITQSLGLNKDYTIYSRIEDDSKIDSSNNLLEEFKIINDISNSYSHDIEKLSLSNFEYIENVIFIDDIIGSGKTVETFFEANKEKLNKVKTFIFCVVILENGLYYLNSYFDKNGFDCQIIYSEVQRPAFTNEYIFLDDNIINENKLRDFEKKLFGNKSKYVLGFENSQALVTFFRNTPNNTLGSFWYTGKKWNGLFPREKDKPEFMKRRRIKKKSPIAYNLRMMEKEDG